MDGSYRPFQQGAQVAVDSTTPAEIRMQPAKFVNVTFDVKIPENTIPAVPIRMAGNLYQLGNTFADLSGGVSTLAARMPTLKLEPGQKYTLSLSLPAGADIRYTYTIGDGFWNTELTSSGGSQIRQLIVPDHDTLVQDTIESWRSEDSAPITFDVTVPQDTPAGDTISIQFNPFYGWTEPIPMWSLGNNQWAYILNGPVGVISNISYRYCRNDQCGSADAADTMGPNGSGHPVNPGSKEQDIKETIQNWAWLNPTATLTSIEEIPVQPRGSSFIAGVEFQPGYHPSWTPLMPKTLDDVQAMGANWTILTPTWTFTQVQPPVLEPVPGRDILLSDLSEITTRALARGQKVALFPTPQFPEAVDDWWSSAPLDYPWWVSWFERYRSFALNYADQAARSGVQTLVLGGDWLGPALPGGTLADGTPSGVPDDAETRWRSLLQEVRTRFNGTVAWAIPADQAANNPPAFLDSVDQVYLQFSAPLANNPTPDRTNLAAEAGRILDEQIQPLHAKLGKPLVLAAAYPSVDGASTACLRVSPDQPCLELSALARPQADISALTIDLQEQADIYSALLQAVNERAWISGFVTTGYYPPAILQDKSASVHGKPAEQILSYWYPRLVATGQ
jgi:Glycoside Hydrolase Family 113